MGHVEGGSLNGRQKQLNYFLPPKSLAVLWTAILDNVAQKNLQQFQPIHLLLDSKNLKVDTKRKTCYDMQQRFERTWASAIDQRHITTMYRDIDKKMCPRETDLTTGSHAPAEPQTLWRRCCLKKYQAGYQPPNCSLSTVFPFSFLRDSGSLTMETRQHSLLRGKGLLYIQFYASVKEVLCAGK
jgi:hypothetical protein